jgi:hypothetical protein
VGACWHVAQPGKFDSGKESSASRPEKLGHDLRLGTGSHATKRLENAMKPRNGDAVLPPNSKTRTVM